MAKKILLAWELGGGRGHLLILGWIANALRVRGFEPVFALLRLNGVEVLRDSIGDSEYYQAPVWPGVIDSSLFYSPGNARTFGDILCGFGLRSPSVVKSMLRAWETLIARIDPAVIVADTAPACLSAARGKVPTVAVGDGFTLPPSTLDRFTVFHPDAASPVWDEAEVLSGVNAALLAIGRSELRALPALFAADYSRASSFDELDPYRKDRKEQLSAPWVPDWNCEVPMTRREIFCYFSDVTENRRTALAALAEVARAGVTVRINLSPLDSATATWLTENGILIERIALSVEEIQRNAGLLVSSGSFGLASCALAAGIPHLVLPSRRDIAKTATGMAIERMGTGRWMHLNPDSPLEPTLLGALILEMFNSAQYAESAKRLAPEFARRLQPRSADVIADLVCEIA